MRIYVLHKGDTEPQEYEAESVEIQSTNDMSGSGESWLPLQMRMGDYGNLTISEPKGE